MLETTGKHTIPRWLSVGAAALVAVAASSPATGQPRGGQRAAQLEPGDVPIDIPGRPRARFNRSAVTKLYDLPFKGEDLNPGEFYYLGKEIHSSSGSQKWGYDLGAWKLRDGAWSSVKPGFDKMDPKNTDYHFYGKPVYAMGTRKIIRCWRNAPENPRPFSAALGDERGAAAAHAGRGLLRPGTRVVRGPIAPRA
jgi:hypothetical protein